MEALILHFLIFRSLNKKFFAFDKMAILIVSNVPSVSTDDHTLSKSHGAKITFPTDPNVDLHITIYSFMYAYL